MSPISTAVPVKYHDDGNDLLTVYLKVIFLSLQTVYFYYKPVKCSYKTMDDIEQELNTSLPGTDSLLQYFFFCS